MGLTLKIVLVLIFVISFEESSSHRILGIFPLNVRSHMMMFEQLMKGLAKRGHQVDVVSTFPLKTQFPNYTDIVLRPALPKFTNNISYENFSTVFQDDIVHFTAIKAGNIICEKMLEDPALQNIIRNPPKNRPYDLVIVEILGAPCFMAFGHHLNVPVVGASSAILYPWTNDVIRNPDNLAFVQNNLLGFVEKMSFWRRLYNVLHTFWCKRYFDYLSSPQTDLVRKHFGPNVPTVRELENNVALILVNSHPTLTGVRSTTPALIEVGGLHVQDEGPDIPAADKKWLDESDDGFVYFTFGSMVTIETFPPRILNVLYKSLGKIAPTRVLMKAPKPELLPPGLPDNVRTFKWMPQIKVLKHKNIRAFITHGGLMGTQEAVTYGVPMIGIPLFADQFFNMDLYVNKKVAVKINFHDLSEKTIDAALNETLYNPKYRIAAKELSDTFLDRPTSALDTACFWIEFVIKHGSKSMRSPALDLAWWQVALLDVYATIFVITPSVIIIAIVLLHYSISSLCGKRTKKLKFESSKKMN